MANMPYRVTVCELPDDPDFSPSWERLSATIASDTPDLVVLPELPFSCWFCIGQGSDDSVWDQAVATHRQTAERLCGSGVPIVFSTPVNSPEGRRNVARIAGGGLDVETHAKRHLPDEEGYWEGSWYDAGDRDPKPVAVGGASVATRLCTEMWNFDTARRLGCLGADIIAIPRTTPLSSRERWICGGRAAAISAGAYCLSSNRSGEGASGAFGGAGWVIDPDGEIIAVTSASCPIVTCEIDLGAARQAKSTYPRYALPTS